MSTFFIHLLTAGTILTQQLNVKIWYQSINFWELYLNNLNFLENQLFNIVSEYEILSSILVWLSPQLYFLFKIHCVGSTLKSKTMSLASMELLIPQFHEIYVQI